MNLNTNIEPDIPRLVRMHKPQNTTITTNNNKEIKKSLNITRGYIYIATMKFKLSEDGK